MHFSTISGPLMTAKIDRMRPLASQPRLGYGRRRRRFDGNADQRYLVGCPRVAPDWELSAVQALIKPQVRGAILYRKPVQVWPSDGEVAARRICELFVASLDRVAGGTSAPEIAGWFDFPTAGEYAMVATVRDGDLPLARAIALLLSEQFHELWFVVDRLFARAGRFYRRQYGYKLNLVGASDIHLPRPIRSAVTATQKQLRGAS